MKLQHLKHKKQTEIRKLFHDHLITLNYVK